MAQYFGKQSQYLFDQKRIERDVQAAMLFTVAFGLGYISRKIIEVTDPSFVSMTASLFAFAVCAFFLMNVFRWLYNKSRREEMQFSKGLRGEGRTHYALKKLPDNYTVFQDIKLENRGNIDFVTVGKNGIFAIEVKNRNGKLAPTLTEDNLTVNGHVFERNPLDQTYSQAKALISELGLPVIPVLVFAGKVEVKLGLKMIKGVYVIGIEWLTKLITEYQGYALTEDQLQAAEACLQRMLPKS